MMAARCHMRFRNAALLRTISEVSLRRNTTAHTTEPRPRAALRMPELAELLGISRSTAYALIRSGRLRYIRLPGGSIRVPMAAVDEFLREPCT